MVMIYVQTGTHEWSFTSRYDAMARTVLMSWGGRWNGTSWLVPVPRALKAAGQLKRLGYPVTFSRQSRDPMQEARRDFGGEDDPDTWGPEEYARASREAGDQWREQNGRESRSEHRARWNEQNRFHHNADDDVNGDWFRRYFAGDQQPPPRPPRPDRGQRTWADELLTAAGPELAPRIFKALAAVLHPDTGGDNQLMQQLNAARDRSTRGGGGS